MIELFASWLPLLALYCAQILVGNVLVCCCDCPTKASDDFNRANSLNINTGAPFTWSGDTGSFEIFNNVMATTGDDKRLTCGTAGTAGSMVLTCDIRTTEEGDEVDLHVNKTDDDNHHFARFTIGSEGCITLYERSSGVDTQLATRQMATDDDTFYTAVVYFDDTAGIFAATCNGAEVRVDGVSGSGTKVGLGTGTVASGEFDNFSFTDYGGNCPVAPDPGGCALGQWFFTGTGSNLGCLWEKVAGTSARASNKLKFTASDTRVRCLASNEDDGAMSMTCTFRFATDGDEVRFVVNDNKSTYHYVEVTDSLMSLKTSGGSTLASDVVSLSTNTDYTIQVCFANDKFESRLLETGDFVTANVTTTTSERWAGLACGTITDNVQFDDFFLTKAESDDNESCPDCLSSSCEDCCDEFNPISGSEAVFDVTGTLTDDPCVDCDAFDGEFILPNTGHLGVCTWELCTAGSGCASGALCGIASLQTSCGGVGIFVRLKGGATCSLEAFVHIGAGVDSDSVPSTVAACATYLGTAITDPCDGGNKTLSLQNSEVHGCGGSWPSTVTVSFQSA